MSSSASGAPGSPEPPGAAEVKDWEGHPSRSGLGDQVRAGVVWSAAARIGEKFLSLTVQLVLARLLVPEDFGIIGMAVVFMAVVQATSDLGLVAAIVQRRRADLSPQHLDTAFWTGVGSSGMAVLGCVIVVAPIAAWFYDEPILRGVVSVIAAALLFRGLTAVPRALLTRSLRFNQLALITVASVGIGGGGAVILALAGFGVWSIAFQGVITAVVEVPMYWMAVKWKPRFRFSGGALKEIFGFGAFVTGFDVLVSVSKNLDYLIIGKFAGAAALGAYALAFMLTNVFRKAVMSTMTRVMFPVYGKLQDTPTRAKRYYLTAIRLNTLLAFPVLAFLIAFPAEFVTLVFGERWIEAALPLQLLSLAMMIHTAGGTSSSVMRGLGHVRVQFWVFLGQVTLVSAPVLLTGVWVAGMPGAAFGMIVIKLVHRMVGQYFMKRLIDVSEYDVLRAIAPALMGAILLGAASVLIRSMFGPPSDLLVLAGTAVVVLIPPAIVLIVVLRKEISAVWTLLRTRVSAPGARR